MDVIEFNGHTYPKLQTEGHAAQFCIPFAKHFCKGKGYDIGCNRVEWALPGAKLIDKDIPNNEYDAMHLPDKQMDYIFSSHCLEHLDSWVEAVEYWTTKIRPGGILFLYLPSFTQEYWRPWNNRRHKHIIERQHVAALLEHLKYKNQLYGNTDINNSYTVVGETYNRQEQIAMC